MDSPVEQMLACRTIAVVGASRRREKFGYKIFADLRAKGYQVHPVHPAVSDIDGVPCYKTIADLPKPPEVVCCVVPPAVTEQVARQCVDLGVKFLWMQPGAESPEAIALCREHGIACVHDQCIMIQSLPRRAESAESSDGPPSP
jgi:predicted CoA-binding protein